MRKIPHSGFQPLGAVKAPSEAMEAHPGPQGSQLRREG
jgi:hypothetical protein